MTESTDPTPHHSELFAALAAQGATTDLGELAATLAATEDGRDRDIRERRRAQQVAWLEEAAGPGDEPGR